jgi:glucose uptake protein
MFIVSNYLLAVILCVVTMICWGSWGNTQKLAAKTWRYELFYWDYVIGIVLLALLFGFTLGSTGEEGRSFVADLSQVSSKNFWSAFTGGIIFNASNILLSASISLAGMSVAFPVGVGLALVLGVFINYFGAPQGDPVILFSGVALIVVAIVLNGVASGKVSTGSEESKTKKKGIILAIAAGFLMSFFYRFVAAAMDLTNFENPTTGMLAPYGAFFIFSLGILASNFIFNTLAMKKPFVGEPVSFKQYFKGKSKTHLVGILGGIIWGVGTALSYIAAGKAGPAISYALGQGAPMIAALWGVFIWKEFKGAPKSVNYMLTFMFVLFIAGLSLIVAAGGN